jgi:hypothetical protein
MAEEIDLEAVAALRKKRQFKKFTFRGLELEKLLDLSHDELLNILHARARRRIQRGLTRKPLALIKKLRKAKTGECYLQWWRMEIVDKNVKNFNGEHESLRTVKGSSFCFLLDSVTILLSFFVLFPFSSFSSLIRMINIFLYFSQPLVLWRSLPPSRLTSATC